MIGELRTCEDDILLESRKRAFCSLGCRAPAIPGAHGRTALRRLDEGMGTMEKQMVRLLTRFPSFTCVLCDAFVCIRQSPSISLPPYSLRQGFSVKPRDLRSLPIQPALGCNYRQAMMPTWHLCGALGDPNSGPCTCRVSRLTTETSLHPLLTSVCPLKIISSP